MNYFSLYSNCFVVDGYRRSCIYDLTRRRHYFVPLDLSKLLKVHENNELYEDLQDLYFENRKVIQEYIEFLTDKELCFYTKKPSLYPKLSLKEEVYYKISNIILEYSSKIDLCKLKDIINYSNTGELELRFMKEIEIIEVKKILDCFKKTKLSSIKIIIPYIEGITKDKLFKIKKIYPKITQFVFFNSPAEEYNYVDPYNQIKLAFITSGIELFDNRVMPMHFTINVNYYQEAIMCNPYYYKKLFVNNQNNIVDSLCDQNIIESLDNISVDNLDAFFESNKTLNSLWYSKKDNTVICRDCEYKYMCVDPRVPAQRSNSLFFFKTNYQCPYNPYIAKWKGQDGWISVEQWRAENPNWEEQAIQNRTQQQKEPHTV